MINEGDKPLAIYYFGSVFFNANLKRLQQETSSGAFVTNDTLFQASNNDLPFGGVGLSGSGKYHGYEGFKQFSNSKSVLIKPAMNIYPYNKVYPPFTREKQGLLKGLLKYLGCS